MKMIQKRNNMFVFSVPLTISRLFEVFKVVFFLLILNTHVVAEERLEHEMINFTGGQVGVFDDLSEPQRYGLEYRFLSFSGPNDFRLIPAIGFAASSNNASYLYTDLRHDFYLNSRWILIPSFGVGVFNDSNEIRLGNDIEFRSGFELAYEFKNKVRAGVAIFHLSNGGISSDNPGTEAIVFSVCLPIIEG